MSGWNESWYFVCPVAPSAPAVRPWKPLEVLFTRSAFEVEFDDTEIHLFEGALSACKYYPAVNQVKTELLCIDPCRCEHRRFHTFDEPFRFISEICNVADGPVLVGDTLFLPVTYRDVDDLFVTVVGIT